MKTAQQFEFIAGSPALCLVDTVGNRGGKKMERLNTREDLSRWLRSAGLANVLPDSIVEQDLNEARSLREAIYHCGLAAIDKRRAAAADIARINEIAARPPLRPQWDGDVLVQIGAPPVEAALSSLAADALQTLGSEWRERMRICPGCQMMFLDMSRPGKRRWCSSTSGCGNREKVRNSRARRSRQPSGDSAHA